MDVSEYVEEILELSTSLQELTDEINQAKRRAAAARAEKKEEMKAYDNLFLRSARVFEDFCRYIGKGTLADQVRPSEARSGWTVVEPGEIPSDVLDQIGDLPNGVDSDVTEPDAAEPDGINPA